MAEFTYPVKPIGVDYQCDVCMKGKMVYKNLVFSGPMDNRQTAFHHECSNVDCAHEQDFQVQYPAIRFVALPNPPPEVPVPLTPVTIGRGCDKCKVGRMKSTGKMLTSLPPSYEHACDMCSHVENYTQLYPYPDNPQ